MLGWGNRKKRRKDKAGSGALDSVGDIPDGCIPDGCGCDLPVIAFLIFAAPLLYLLR
jgi:hypothetical protein